MTDAELIGFSNFILLQRPQLNNARFRGMETQTRC